MENQELTVDEKLTNLETGKHISRVRDLLQIAAFELLERGKVHDASKLEHPEVAVFTKFTPLLKASVYNSPEYKEQLKSMGVGLDHHYANNSHHPQYYKDGIDGMDLFDIIEMFMDWKAAGERHAKGSLMNSIDQNIEKFGMSEQLVKIFRNTAQRYERELDPNPNVKLIWGLK